VNAGQFFLDIDNFRFQAIQFFRQFGDGGGRIEQYHAHDGNDAALVPQRYSVDQETGVSVIVAIPVTPNTL